MSFSSKTQLPTTPTHTLNHTHTQPAKRPAQPEPTTTQPVEPGRTSNELRRLLSSPLSPSATQMSVCHPTTPRTHTPIHPAKHPPSVSATISLCSPNYPATRYANTQTRTHTHTQPNAQSIRTNHR